MPPMLAPGPTRERQPRRPAEHMHPAGADSDRGPDPVGLEYTIMAMTCVFSRRRVVCQAAIWYLWVSPPRTCFRRIRCSVRLIGSGGWVSA